MTTEISSPIIDAQLRASLLEQTISLHEDFAVRISIAQAINPVGKTNWEQRGVVPDIAIPADAALDRAHALALHHVLTLLGEGPRGPFALLAEEARTALAALEGRDHGSC